MVLTLILLFAMMFTADIAICLYKENKSLKKQALYDGLTGLANRSLFMDRLELKLSHANRYDERVGILFLDLDGFKKVNDTLGHDAGDEVLKITAQRLRACTRDSDTVSRFGGDEFAIILPEANSLVEVCEVANRVILAISTPIPLGESMVHIGTSVGISFRPTHGEDLKNLIKLADQAMYKSKSQGKNRYSVA